MVDIVVHGADGRMGRAVVEAVLGAGEVRLAGAIAGPRSGRVGEDAGELAGCSSVGVTLSRDLASAAATADVIVDFTRPAGLREVLGIARDAGAAVVSGTTGLGDDDRAALKEASASIPVVHAPNMSLGVNLCCRLVELAARALGREADAEILESHHRRKVDAPSGTAWRLGEAVASAREQALSEAAVLDRSAQSGAREPGSIGFASLRGGDIVGEHTVMFATEAERVEITHRAATRGVFAQGALRAAVWVANRPAGLYGMEDVLGL